MTANRTRSTTSKKAPTKKATTKKATTRKAATGKSTSRTTATRDARDAPRAESAQRVGAVELAGLAAQQLAELTGRASEGVTRLERSDEGWTVELEVLELRRIPETTDVLATYEARLDDRGRLQSYQRVSRYVRGAAGQERG